MKKRYVYNGITLVLFALMGAVAIALWRGVIPIDWLASLGYRGIFFLSLINGIAPVAGPSQIATFFVASKLNPLAIGLAAGIGGAVGELAGYTFGYFLRGSQPTKVEDKIQRIANWRFLRISRERSFIPLFVLASIPNPFFDPVSALAGLLKIGFARYFLPVLLGKTVRHLVIAYAGYHMISGKLPLIIERVSMIIFNDTAWFVVGVFGIALLAWLVRSLAESEPDPFLLNFTFFAFAGQCVLTGELIHDGTLKGAVIGLDLAASILVIIQVLIFKQQVSRTLEHYEDVLERNNIGGCSPDEIERWAAVLVRITGVDFYPEFYTRISRGLGPRDKRRRQAVLILPRDKFRDGGGGVTPATLTVPPEERQALWRLYAGTCILSWVIFILCIVVARWHQ